ncbi:phage capsid protein [Streptomyces sp. NPDC006544]|uniref:phage capsid protein n=1 Tax=Streptomyces sp. NPDC006544 TaxID=3154583 RepID=UPI00339FDFFD
MALPETGAAWPPPQWAPIYDRIRIDDAWYSGDPKRLGRLQGDAQEQLGRRRMWGRRSQPAAGRDNRLHIPLPGDIATTSADLLFADMPAIRTTDRTTQGRLEQLLDEGRVQQTCLGGAEQAAALSGVFLRVTWDKDLAARPLLTVVQPDAAIPEHRFGMLRACTFWEELPSGDGATVWRHFERHEPGRVIHALYRGTSDNVGRPVPLGEHPATADLVASLDPDGDGQTISTGIPLLTCTYVPNIGPNRHHRGSPIGRSDYAAPLYDLFDNLDTVWTSWMRDIRLARARLIVPTGYLRSEGPGKGASFEDREVYEQLNMPPNEQGATITLTQFDIRVEEHQRTAEAIMRQAAQSAGYSAQSFGLHGEGEAITATESDSRDQRSMVTRKKKSGYWRHGLADMLHVMLWLDAVQFGTPVKPERPSVEFGDGVTESEQQTATTLDLLARAQSASTRTRVKILHPEWDDTAVQEEVAAILAETGAAPDPVGTFPLAA